MIRLASALSPFALLAAAQLAAQDARDFQLPPAATPTPDNRVQGPVDPDAPVPVRPRVIETTRPTPTAPPTSIPAPRATAPTIDLRAPPPAPVTRADAARARAQAAQPTATASLPAVPDAPAQTPSDQTATPIAVPTAAPIAPSADGTAPITTPAATEEPPVWPWLALVALVLAAGLWHFGKRRKAVLLEPAQIEMPVIPAVPTGPAEALAISVEAVRLDRSVMNATVNYRVTIRNRTTRALNGVAVEADLVSASNDRPTEQQLASPAQALTPRHSFERLAPGQSMRIEGQVRLPLSEASAIWQGRAALLVPLLRVRATAADAAPIATTLVIGRSDGQAARPQPFRLDEPPRSYAPLAQRVLDSVPAPA